MASGQYATWNQVELGRSAALHVRRAKNGKPSVHPLRGDEVRASRELGRQYLDSGFVFATERGGPFTPDAVNRLIKRIGERAGFPFNVHAPPRLRLRSGERRPRHASYSGLARPPVNSAHRPLHGAGADAVQELLALDCSTNREGGQRGRPEYDRRRLKRHMQCTRVASAAKSA
jgi:hypothetical protein